MDINQIIEKIKKINIEKKWDNWHTPSNLAKSIIIEASELLENYQWSDEAKDFENVKDEIADVLIYSLIFCYKNNLDPKEVILNKLEKNIKKKY